MRIPTPRPPRAQQILIDVSAPTADPPMVHGIAGGADTSTWRDREILRLEALLSDAGLGAGAPESTETPSEQVLSLLHTGDGVNQDAVRHLITAMVSTSGLVEAVQDLEVAGQLSSLIEQAHRRRGLGRLIEVIENPASTSDELRAVIRQESWVFGGRYIPPFATEKIPELAQLSLPLMRTDGAIHVVEVGAANVPQLIIAGDGSQYDVGVDVQRSVNCAINQLRMLDELSERIEHTMHLETRRALATVVIGHRRYLPSQDAREALPTTLRTYGSHLAGIDIVTYDELVYNAERALAID